MEMKIMLAAALFFAGFLWVYLIIRQLLFNLAVAYPTLNKMKALKEDLIVIGAWRYTHISMAVCILFSAVVLFVVFRFCPTYMLISFGVGSLICFLFLVTKIKPENKAMFDSFCNAYCRFVPDDELRTLMFRSTGGCGSLAAAPASFRSSKKNLKTEENGKNHLQGDGSGGTVPLSLFSAVSLMTVLRAWFSLPRGQCFHNRCSGRSARTCGCGFPRPKAGGLR